ncbi:hypothetical protein K402DRAFT_100723 [Aulographum hederae CBS 113979]|uniref:MARVEL domain-containing protein n=1 Tax=Aulographum hederae CBS 113979 TaxID=1176131 RepID=A0A6G1GYA2_9PEZI|nr:hypothetical protein K402DRAFT_100723 [Aulographum hederae CBS 113979]
MPRPLAAHIVVMPHPGFFALRIIQLVLSVLVLALAATEVYWFSVLIGATPDGLGVSLFTCVVTFIVIGYYLITTTCAQNAYNYWAVMSLDIFLVIFWLITFALDAVWTAWVSVNFTSLDNNPVFAVFATLTCLAVINFLLFIVSLVWFSITMHRHRKSGAPNTPKQAHKNPTATSLEKLETGKAEATPLQLTTTEYPQQTAAPPYPQQQQQQPQYQQPMPQQQQQQQQYPQPTASPVYPPQQQFQQPQQYPTPSQSPVQYQQQQPVQQQQYQQQAPPQGVSEMGAGYGHH